MDVVLTPAVACDVLGLGLNPGIDEIKSAFRKKALETHPDRVGGDTEAFKRVKAAYDLLMPDDESGQTVAYDTSESEAPEKDLSFGDWLDVLSIVLDGRVYPFPAKAQLAVVNDEVLISVYLSRPWVAGSGRVEIQVREKNGGELAAYDREILQRSMDLQQRLSVLWFSPFEQRMRFDGVPVGHQPQPEPARPAPRSSWNPNTGPVPPHASPYASPHVSPHDSPYDSPYVSPQGGRRRPMVDPWWAWYISRRW